MNTELWWYCITMAAPSCLFTFIGSTSLYQSIKLLRHIIVIEKKTHEHGDYSLYKLLHIENIIEI